MYNTKRLKTCFNLIMIVQIVVWVVFAVLSYFVFTKSILNSLLMLCNSVGFLIIFLLFSKNLFFKICSQVYVLINLVLTITDQMGLADYFVLALNFVCSIILQFYMIALRRENSLTKNK